jgi:hypothetical protein
VEKAIASLSLQNKLTRSTGAKVKWYRRFGDAGRGAPCEMYEIVFPSLGASFCRESTGRNQTAGQLRMSAMLRHEERARRFFLGAERRLL